MSVISDPKRELSAYTPRVSVILTVYRRTEYLAEALDSVLNQTYRNFEIVVADDSGTEAARGIVAKCADCERIRYLPNATTIGIAASLVNAVRQARGEFIAILNDDDLWEPDLLENLVPPLIEDTQVVQTIADHSIMDAAGQIDNSLSENWSRNFGRASLAAGIISNAAEFAINGGSAVNITSVFRKDAIDWSLVVPEVAGAYDFWIGCLLAAALRPIYFVPKRLARWRVHGQMETGRRSHDKGENLVYIYSTMIERGWFPELKSVLKARLADALLAVGRDKLQFARTGEARIYFWRSFLLSRRLKTFARTAAACLPQNVQNGLKRGVLRMRRYMPLEQREQEKNV